MKTAGKWCIVTVIAIVIIGFTNMVQDNNVSSLVLVTGVLWYIMYLKKG